MSSMIIYLLSIGAYIIVSHLSVFLCILIQTIITISFTPLGSHDNYALEWKEYPQVSA